MIRNRYLVDKSQHLHAFYDLRGRGGTYNTLEYAKSTGKSHSITVMVDQDLNKYIGMSETTFRSFMDSARVNGVGLSCVKGIITSYFKEKKGYLTPDVVEVLRSW